VRLVVGYLATPDGDDGVALAVRLARTLGARIDLCMVLPPDRILGGRPGGGNFDPVLSAQARMWLDAVVATVPDDVEVASHISFNESPAQGLLEQSARLEADAIVIGASAAGLMGRYSIGSVTADLLYSAPVPLALAPRGMRYSKTRRVREVTCAVGQRQGAGLLLDYAVRVSRAAATPLRLVSLVALDPVFGRLRGDADAVRDAALEHARKILDAAKAVLPEDFPVVATVVDGPTVESAVNKVDWHDGDLIMVGSGRLGPPDRLFLGATANKMLRVLEVPMIVVPRDQFTEDDLP
jgi:nucleotide-binding universal stress UspA family protein